MEEFIEDININQYLPEIIAGASNVLFAILILLVGLFIASKASKIINTTGA